MQKFLFRAFGLIFCLGVMAQVARAQETTSEIVGTITDGQKAVVGATVTALHNPTGTKYVTTSRNDGRYNLPNLKIGGPYTITVSFVGDKEEKQENVTLLLGQEFRADFVLKSEAQSLQGVTVTTVRQDKVFNNNRTGGQEIINRSQIDRLPTINRSLQDFTKLEPTSNGLNIGGRSNQYNNMTVDGANFNNSFGLSSVLGGQTGSQPISLDAIEQIQVNIAPYDVTQGGFSGTGINSVTRSGTNTFRGSVYTFLKGPGTQGYNVGTAKVVKTDFSFNTSGFTIGGPIVKNKLFFFLSAEEVRQTAPATAFVAASNGNPSGTNVSTVNASTLDSLSAFLKDKFGYDAGAYQGYSFKTSSDKITAKIDWNINRTNTLSIKYNYLKSSSDQFASSSRPNSAGGQITGGQPGLTSMPFFNSGYVINNNFNIVIAELNTRFSSSVSNKIQAGYTALRDFRSAHGGSNFPLVDILNNGNIFTTFGYEPFTYNNVLNTDVYQFSDILKIYKGSHELTFGTQDYYRKYANAFAPGYQGSYQFNSLQDFYNSVNDNTTLSRNYYLQYSALKGGAFPWAYAGSTELGFFAQDKWRVKNNFTLTYGLRVDLTIYKQAFTDNPSFDALKFKNGQSYNIGAAPETSPLFSPRVGFNWDVLSDKTLQVRGGIGLFAGPPPFVWISNQASNNGTQFGSLYAAKPFDANPDAYRPTAGAANTTYAIALTDHDFKYPQVLKGSIAIDKKLGNDLVLTVEGNWSKDINAVYYQNINLNETNGYKLDGADGRMRFLTGDYSSNKYYYSQPTSNNSADNTLSNPNITSAILMSNSSKGYAYTATARIQKTYRNFFASLAYTFSEAKNVAEGGSTASSLWSARAVADTDPNADNLAFASYYLPHRVVAYASYRFEYGKHFATSIGAIFEAAPAGTTSYVYNGDVNGDGNAGNDLIYIPKDVSEINLVKSGSGPAGTNASTDPRSGTIGTGAATVASKSQIWTQLNNFINQDHYLSQHRGEYAKANAVLYPFYKRVDLNITQDIYFTAGSTKHTLRLTLDLVNAGNFLNKYWGTYKTPNLTNFLRYEGLGGANGKTPVYSFTYLDAGNQVPLTNSFKDDASILSRWQMQFGVRYIFN